MSDVIPLKILFTLSSRINPLESIEASFGH